MLFREIYKPFLKCSLYEDDVNVADQCNDQKSRMSKVLIPLDCLGILVLHCARMS